jgi:hypothetical protein
VSGAFLRFAAFLYRQALRIAMRVMPPGARGEMQRVFDTLQRDAYRDHGARGLAGYWLREFASLARVSISPPRLPGDPLTVSHDTRGAGLG